MIHEHPRRTMEQINVQKLQLSLGDKDEGG